MRHVPFPLCRICMPAVGDVCRSRLPTACVCRACILSAVEVSRACIPAVGVCRSCVSAGRCADLLVLAEDALAGDTLVLTVDLTVRAEGTLVVAACPLVLTMDVGCHMQVHGTAVQPGHAGHGMVRQ